MALLTAHCSLLYCSAAHYLRFHYCSSQPAASRLFPHSSRVGRRYSRTPPKILLPLSISPDRSVAHLAISPSPSFFPFSFAISLSLSSLSFTLSVRSLSLSPLYHSAKLPLSCAASSVIPLPLLPSSSFDLDPSANSSRPAPRCRLLPATPHQILLGSPPANTSRSLHDKLAPRTASTSRWPGMKGTC